MPFRTPHNYENLTIVSRDATAVELRDYIEWLRRELALAELALEKQSTPEESKT